MKKRNFTLIELLIVIGIIGILAGLVLGGVTVAKQRGRITQARADMTSLRTAFEGMYRDYGRMAKSVSGGNYALGGHNFSVTDGCITIGEWKSYADYSNTEKEQYCNTIAELADPGNSSLTVSLNRRRIKYLDPRTAYDPSRSPTYSQNNIDNTENTWLDPWGNPYLIRINVDASEQIPDPSKASGHRLAGRIILWSLGPDGRGSSGSYSDDTNKDNIAGWKDGDWLD